MTGRPDHPAFRALEIGPGGIPADRVRTIGERDIRAAGTGFPPSPAERVGPSAVFGSFDTDASGPPRCVVLGWCASAVAVGVLVATCLWSGGSEVTTASGDLQPGTCLSSSANHAVVLVDCSSPDAEFAVAARTDDATGSARCESISADLVLVTRDDAVLCLNYRATVGECLFAAAAQEVGKAPCRTPGSTTTPTGLFRVIAVLDNSVDQAQCPKGTLESLVHIITREVLCLGLP